MAAKKNGRGSAHAASAEHLKKSPKETPAEVPNAAASAGSVGLPDRPVALAVAAFALVPDELKALPRWLLWKYVPHTRPGGKPHKKPLDLAGGHGLDATRPANGRPFAEVVAAYATAKAGTYAGIGFVLGDGIGGTDCDGCIDSDGKLDATGRAQAEAFAGTYTEVSPSGTGFKTVCRLDPKRVAHVGRKVGQEELYSGKRWFAITGKQLPGYETMALADKTGAFLAMAERLGARNKKLDDVDRGPPADAGERFLRFHVPNVSLARATHWLHALDPDAEEPEWFQRRMLPWALQFGWEGFDVFDDWSSFSHKYQGPDDVRAKYRHAMEMNAALDTREDNVMTVRTIKKNAEKVSEDESDGLFDLQTGTEVMNEPLGDDEPILGALLPLGVSMLAGSGGAGKSTILATAAAHITNGKPLLPWERDTTTRAPGVVLWLTVEEDVRQIVIPRHEKLGGNLGLILTPRVKRAKDKEEGWFATDFDIDRDLPGMLAKAAARGMPVKMVVCDSLPGLVQWRNRSPTSDPDVKRLIGHLGYIAHRFGCAIAGIAHWNKKTDLAEEHRMSGAQAWRDTPRLSYTCEAGYIYNNKSNDLRPVGCTFSQEVLAVLRTIDAVTENDEPYEVTARRAVFGPHLVAKDVLLARKKEQTGMPVVSAHAKGELRIDRLCRETMEIFDVLGSPLPSANVWKAVGEPNGNEKKDVRRRLGLVLDKSSRPVMLAIVSAASR